MIHYDSSEDLFIERPCYQMVLDLTSSKTLKRYYKSHNALEVLDGSTIKTLAKKHPKYCEEETFATSLIHTICKDDYRRNDSPLGS